MNESRLSRGKCRITRRSRYTTKTKLFSNKVLLGLKVVYISTIKMLLSFLQHIVLAQESFQDHHMGLDFIPDVNIILIFSDKDDISSSRESKQSKENKGGSG